MNNKNKQFFLENNEGEKQKPLIITNETQNDNTDIINNNSDYNVMESNVDYNNINNIESNNLNDESLKDKDNVDSLGAEYEYVPVKDTIFDLYYADKENESKVIVLGVDKEGLNFTVGITDVLFILTMNNNYINEKNVPLISKMCVIREIKEINLNEMSKIFYHLGIDILNIVSINCHVKYTNITLQKITKPIRINYITMDMSQFIEHISKPYFNFIENNKNTLYILRGGSFIRIKDLFNKVDNGKYSIGRGGLQKSHMLSPLDIRFSFYLIAMFNFDFKLINYLNTFNDIPKSRYLPYIDNTSKYKTTIVDNKIVRELVPKKNLFRRDGNVFSNDNKKLFHTIASSRNSQDNSVKLESPIFNYLDQIEDIVNNSESLYKAQEKIEVSWISLMKERLEDPAISSWQMLPSLIKKSYRTLEKAEVRGIFKKRFKYLSNDISLYKKDLAILTIGVLMSNYNRISKTNISIKLGNEIAFYLYKQSTLKNKYSYNKFEDWKKERDLDNVKSLFRLGDYFVLLFTNEPTPLFEVDFNEDEYIDTNSDETLKISGEYIEVIKDTLYVHPTSLPMLSPPLPWDEKTFGGFIENQYEQNPVNIGSRIHGHKIENKEKLFKTINSLNPTQFNINKNLLNYVLNEGKFLLDDQNEKQAFQNNITLKVAKIYSKYNFYLNLNSDWRGRLYTNSFFITYQGGDLSKSLIEFAEGEVLNEEGVKYLYICCANLYSSLISKKSYTYRISWVKKNLDKITSLNTNFIKKANKKIQFASICITIKNYHADNSYKVKSPIFLDATCSGIQHLAAMLQDINMGTHVNLISKNEEEDVADLYETVVEPTNKAINKYGDEDPLHKNLSNVLLTRKILKPSIMTTVYAVTISGIFNQLKSQFNKKKIAHLTEKTKEGKPRYNTFYIVPSNNGKDLLLSYSDVYKMAEIVKNETFNVYPNLRYIYDYFINTTKLLVKLNLPVVWFTPLGIEITQLYIQQDVKKVSLNNFGKTRKRVYREPNNILDKNKQSQAIIPNIIHSLDASHLISVINYAYEKDITPIITVHDCFGTLPNKMERLSQIVRSRFALLYTQENFLEKYNKRVISTIIDNNYEIVEKDNKKFVLNYEIKEKKDGKKIIKTNKKLYEIPKLPDMGSLDLNKIIKAIYLIS